MIGESLSLLVALSFTATALFAEVGSKRMGSVCFNAVRMSMSLVFLALTLLLTMGAPWPRYADGGTWMWLALSGAVGYVVGDYCLMQGYIIIGARFGQLFMTLSAPTAAILGRIFMGEQIKPLALVGMVVTLSGIAISILSKQGDTEKSSHSLKLSVSPRGIVIACMAGICQGAGLVLSKIGMQHYYASLAEHGIDGTFVHPDAIIPLPFDIAIPFASTMMRGIVGLIGFFALLLFLRQSGGIEQLGRALRDRKAVASAFWSMIFGPFVGVSLSLTATLYTSTGIAQTLFALTPVLIIAPSALLFHQKVTAREVLGAVISVIGASMFFL